MTVLVFLGSKENLHGLTNAELIRILQKPINFISYNEVIFELIRRRKLQNKVVKS